MRKLLYLLVGVLLAAFILPSCNSSLSITKRRYTKGYFVQHNKGKQHIAKQRAKKEENKTAESAVSAETFKVADFVTQPEHNPAPATNGVITARAVHQQAGKVQPLKASEVPELVIKHPFKAIASAGSLVRSADTGDDALSLLWLVVVVILILYLLGILFEIGGGAIHILGVIALVLLILWLLRLL